MKPLSRERQRFLTRTSILERLSGPLCDAILRRSGSARTLESIERGNLLVVPLDRDRQWYRYQLLFREALTAELHRREPDMVSRAVPQGRGLVRVDRPARGGDETRACRGDLKRTGELLQRQLLSAYRGGRIATMRAWFDRLGDAAEHDPGLAIAWAWVSALTGDPAAADRWLDVSERLRPSGPSLHGTASLGSSLALVRAIMTRDGPGAMLRDARRAVHEEPETSPYRSAALSFLGLAALLGGDAERADAVFEESAATGERMAAYPSVSVAVAERSLIAAARGDREQADAFAGRALEIVESGNLSEHITSGPVYAASALAALRAGDRDRAQQYLTVSPQAPTRPFVCVPLDLGADPARARACPGRALRRGGRPDAPRRR